jgi:hypothetical protein
MKSWKENEDVLGIHLIVGDGVKNTHEYDAYIGHDKPFRNLAASYVCQNNTNPVSVYIQDSSLHLCSFHYTNYYIRGNCNNKVFEYPRNSMSDLSTPLDIHIWDNVSKISK